jgi:hypothetical protein
MQVLVARACLLRITDVIELRFGKLISFIKFQVCGE